MRNHVERVLKPFDLTGEQAHILKNIDISAGRSQNELCELVDKTPANITRILDRLEKKNLIIRRDNPEDRRSSLVFQTSAGARLSASVAKLFEQLSAEIERDISPEDIAGFRNVLAQIDTNLDRLSDQNGD
jgi:DNA-binding MarR family transcriptional regulator